MLLSYSSRRTFLLLLLPPSAGPLPWKMPHPSAPSCTKNSLTASFPTPALILLVAGSFSRPPGKSAHWCFTASYFDLCWDLQSCPRDRKPWGVRYSNPLAQHRNISQNLPEKRPNHECVWFFFSKMSFCPVKKIKIAWALRQLGVYQFPSESSTSPVVMS